MKLEGKVAVVTGGTSGIGLAVAQAFISEGAIIAVCGRDSRRLDAAGVALGDRALLVPCDVTVMTDLESLFQEVEEKLGKIDIVVVNAGGGGAPIQWREIDEEQFDEVSAQNFKSVFFTVQKAEPHINDGASVVVITSGANRQGYAGGPIYGAAKAAARALVRSLSEALVKRGVRVNAVSPGLIDTALNTRILSGEFRDALVRRIPMRRVGTPEEVAKAVVFLASDDSSYVLGVELDVDGGILQL